MSTSDWLMERYMYPSALSGEYSWTKYVMKITKSLALDCPRVTRRATINEPTRRPSD